MLKLSKVSYDWALKHLRTEGDTDFFPPPFEIEAIRYNWNAIINQLAALDLSTYEWSPGRRFTVPKGQQTFRNATQLDPLDSLILAAIIKKYGAKLEAARISLSQGRVFSYRFDPQPDGRLYGTVSRWHDFWQTSLNKVETEGHRWVALADITDYYNQIYHHVLGNQLRAVGWPKQLAGIIEKRFLGTLTHGVSRGIPVGPHTVHLFAEAALVPIDNSLLARGLDFCRYADDYHFFCNTEEEARIALYDFAEVLDKQQRLTIQNQKVQILQARDFAEVARSMLVDRPLNTEEEAILKVIRKYSPGGPYAIFSLSRLSEQDLKVVSGDKLSALFELYLNRQTDLYSDGNVRNYPRIGWLLRRIGSSARVS